MVDRKVLSDLAITSRPRSGVVEKVKAASRTEARAQAKVFSVVIAGVNPVTIVIHRSKQTDARG